MPTSRCTRRRALACCLLLRLAGCASYQPLALQQKAMLAPSVSALRHEGVAPGGPLGVRDVVLLAVQNDPDLVAARAQRGVARAQVLQAGLLPDPQVNGAILPLLAGVGSTNAFNAGFTEDIKALITAGSRRRTAAAAAAQVDAQLLWQEWQVIGQARLLAVDIILDERSVRLLQSAEALFKERGDRSSRAVAAGNATLVTLAPDLAALQAARAARADQQLQLAQKRQALCALLGLAPGAALPLADEPLLPPFDPGAMAGLPDRRPDLVALRSGYKAQDARYRTAILSQFPNLIFGVTGGSDNMNVRNIGPQATIELPVFDRNQGNVAIERATRQQLHDEYAARLAAAEGEVHGMAGEMALLDTQLADIRADLGAVRSAATRARTALAQGTIDERSAVDLIAGRLAKEQEIVILERARLERQAALATLTGAGMPPIALLP